MKFEDLTNAQLKTIIRNYNNHLKIKISELKKRDQLLSKVKEHFEINDNQIKLKNIEPMYIRFLYDKKPPLRSSVKNAKSNIKTEPKYKFIEYPKNNYIISMLILYNNGKFGELLL